jgi:hypothetical protein
MNAIALSCIAFVCISGGALLGMLLRNALSGHHLSTDAKDVVRLGTGLIGTIAALVLGLLIASAKSSYDTQSSQLKQMTANIVLLDNLLVQYGPKTETARNLLRRSVVILTDRMWRENSSDLAKTTPFEASAASEVFYAKLQGLSPQNDSERALQARAIQTSTDVAQTRLLLFVQTNNSIPMPFLVVLIFWLTIIFARFSLFAQPNAIVIGSLFVFVLSAAGAIYLILEPGQPFAGLMQISSAPLRSALVPLGT